MELLAALMAGFCLGFGVAGGHRLMFIFALAFALAGLMLSFCKK